MSMDSVTSWFKPRSPQRTAARELQEARRMLLQAEQHLLHARMQADYYRDLVAFLDTVQESGVESVSDRRRACASAGLRPPACAAGLETVPVVPITPFAA
ncbi:hypothetical protein [Cupriavidus sp. USMAHM13]|nr:hypothetical protein [Cupriavidus sp. USMAHM13]